MIWSADAIWNLLIIFNYFHPVYATPFTGFITLVPLLLIVSSCIKLLGILQGRNNLEIIQISCKLPINVVNVFMNTEAITISCHLITSLLVNSLLRYICFHKQILVILMNDHYLPACFITEWPQDLWFFWSSLFWWHRCESMKFPTLRHEEWKCLVRSAVTHRKTMLL